MIMQKYIGTKVINAVSMTRKAYNDFRGWTVPADENPADEGFLIEVIGGFKNTVQYNGYVQWLPTESFNFEYRPSDNLTFGLALEALKKGSKLARKGWNGKGLLLELAQPTEDSLMTLPYIYMAYPSSPASDTAPSNHINARVPWLASQTDVLADDWVIVD